MSQEFINQHTVEHNGRHICKYFLEGRCIKVNLFHPSQTRVGYSFYLSKFICKWNVISMLHRGTSASLNMIMLFQRRRKNCASFMSRDTVPKETSVYTCTISFQNISWIRFYRLAVRDNLNMSLVKKEMVFSCLFLILDLDPKVYVSILASSFTPEQSVIKETTASSPTNL